MGVFALAPRKVANLFPFLSIVCILIVGVLILALLYLVLRAQFLEFDPVIREPHFIYIIWNYKFEWASIRKFIIHMQNYQEKPIPLVLRQQDGSKI